MILQNDSELPGVLLTEHELVVLSSSPESQLVHILPSDEVRKSMPRLLENNVECN